MALLFIDGFDHCAADPALGGGTAGTNANAWLTKWGAGDAFLSHAKSGPVRTGTGSLKLWYSNYSVLSRNFVTSGACIIGFAFYNEAMTDADGPFFYLREGSINHVRLEFSLSHLRLVRGDGVVLQTGPSSLVANNWYYLELKVLVGEAGVGTWELHLDGVTELAGSGDTRNGGSGTWDRFLLLGTGSNADLHLDDLYLCDASGVRNNTFLGPVRVQTLLPQPDTIAPGTHAGLTPSTGVDHGALVDEVPPNVSDYNSSAIFGSKDTYQYASLTMQGDVLGIQTNLYAAKADAAPRTVCTVVRTGGQEFDSPNVSPLTTFSYFPRVWESNPSALPNTPWTPADIAAIEVGMKITA